MIDYDIETFFIQDVKDHLYITELADGEVNRHSVKLSLNNSQFVRNKNRLNRYIRAAKLLDYSVRIEEKVEQGRRKVDIIFSHPGLAGLLEREEAA